MNQSDKLLSLYLAECSIKLPQGAQVRMSHTELALYRAKMEILHGIKRELEGGVR